MTDLLARQRRFPNCGDLVTGQIRNLRCTMEHEKKIETSHGQIAPWQEAKELARPLPNDALIILASEPYGSSIVSNAGEPVEADRLL